MKNKLIFLFLFCFSYIIPKKKDLIICGGGDAKQFQGNGKYLLLHLKNHNPRNLEFYWSSKSKKQQEELNELNIPFIDPYSWNGFWKILRAQYLFIEKSSIDVYYTKHIFGKFNFIQTWHGTPLKKIGRDSFDDIKNPSISSNPNHFIYKMMKKLGMLTRQKFKLITAPSEEVQTIFKRTFENDNVAITGYPRNDVLFQPDLAIHNYQEQLGLKHYKKIILYAPTFRDDSYTIQPFSDQLDKYNQQLKDVNYLMIVKKHPWQKTLEIPQDLTHIVDLSSSVDDINELLPFVDILITDYSSVFFDYMLSQKPIIYFPYDIEDYLKNCRGMYYDYYNKFQGPFAHNEEELFNLILTNETWSNDENYLNKYHQVITEFHQFKDGSSSERLLNYLFDQFSFSTIELIISIALFNSSMCFLSKYFNFSLSSELDIPSVLGR